MSIIENGQGINCCKDGKPLEPKDLHEACFPIVIPVDDPFFSDDKLRHSCMSFVRSTPAPRLQCTIGHGEQVDKLA